MCHRWALFRRDPLTALAQGSGVGRGAGLLEAWRLRLARRRVPWPCGVVRGARPTRDRAERRGRWAWPLFSNSINCGLVSSYIPIYPFYIVIFRYIRTGYIVTCLVHRTGVNHRRVAAVRSRLSRRTSVSSRRASVAGRLAWGRRVCTPIAIQPYHLRYCTT